MQAWSRWILGLFLSPIGVTVLAALDSTLFFSFPLGIDAAVVMLAAGALEVDAKMFFGTLVACRTLRFGGEALLAVLYGRRILRWLDSDLFHDIVAFFIVVAIVASIMSIIRIVRATRPARRRRAA